MVRAANKALARELDFFYFWLQWDLFLFMLHGLVEYNLMGNAEIESYLQSLQEFAWPSVSICLDANMNLYFGLRALFYIFFLSSSKVQVWILIHTEFLLRTGGGWAEGDLSLFLIRSCYNFSPVKYLHLPNWHVTEGIISQNGITGS